MAWRHLNTFYQRLQTIGAHISMGHTRNLREKCNSLCTTAASKPWVPEMILDKKDLGKLTVRTMTDDDVNKVTKLLLTRDLIDFSETDIYSMRKSPNFLGIVIENEDKEIVCYGGANRYSKTAVGAGHMIVLGKYRKAALTTTVIDYTHKHFLHGTPLYSYGYDELIPLYETIGFHFDKSFGKFFRINGHFRKEYIKKDTGCRADILQAKDVDFQKLSRYDATIHTEPRSEILRAMCFHPQSKAYVAINGNDISGYAILRKTIRCYKIAPLFANATSTARALYQRVAEDVPRDSTVSMVVTSNNNHFEELMRENTFEIVHSLWRTTTDDSGSVTFRVDFDRVFSLTNSNYALC